MQTHTKQRLEIFVETTALERITALLRQAGVTGYTVFPAQAGWGSAGGWSLESTVTDAQRMVAVVAILDQGLVDRVLTDVFPLVRRQIGILNLSEVQVVRADRF
jgi:PII-like signaling protein